MTPSGLDDNPQEPDEVEALLDRAAVLLELDREDQALALLQRALTLGPDRPATLLGLAEACPYSSDDYKQTLELTERAIALDPDNPWAHKKRCDILTISGRYAEGRAEAREAVRLAPEDPFYWDCLVFTLTANGPAPTPAEVDEAVRAAERLGDLAPDISSTYARLGEVASIRRQWNAMETHLRRALALSPDWPYVIKMLGSLLICRGRVDEGYRLVYEALRVSPDDERAAVVLNYWLTRLLFPTSLPGCVLLEVAWLALWNLGHVPWPLAYAVALLFGAALTALLLWRRPDFAWSLYGPAQRFSPDMRAYTRRWWHDTSAHTRMAKAAALLPLSLKLLWMAMSPEPYWEGMSRKLHRL